MTGGEESPFHEPTTSDPTDRDEQRKPTVAASKATRLAAARDRNRTEQGSKHARHEAAGRTSNHSHLKSLVPARRAAFGGWLAGWMARPRPDKSPRQDPIRPVNEMVFFLSGRPRRRSNPAQAPFSPVSAPVPSPEQETAASFFLLSRPAAFGFASQFSPGTDRAGHFTRHPWQQQKAVRHELKKARSKRLVRAGSTYGAPN